MIFIKKLKRRKIMEICLWLLFVGVSYLLWDFDGFYETAAYYDNNSLIEVLDDPTYSKILYALNDNDAESLLKDYRLRLVNNTYREEKYNIYIGISKNIDQNHIKIKTDELKYLNDMYSYEDNEYCYYLLDSNILQGEERDYNFSLYNDLNGENFQPYDLKFFLEKL